MAETGYTPIDCDNHDQLESLATLGREVRVKHRDESGGERTQESTITDVFTRDGAEWIRLREGDEIRLDRIVSVEAQGDA
jgi:Rho-binding antiterminator